MTQEEIIAMAREAGFRTGHIDLTVGEPVPFIAPASGTSCIVEVQRLVALAAEKAAAKEREACAKVCDELAELNRTAPTDSMWQWGECAAAIRTRGTKEGV